MLVVVECPVKINQMVWLRNGSSIEHVKVTGFEANANQQRVRLERQDKERAVWEDAKDYNKTFSSDPRVILDRIEDDSDEVLETLNGETPKEVVATPYDGGEGESA
jgi:hypothetical protein